MDNPAYYSAKQIMARTGVARSTFFAHLKANLCGIRDAQDEDDGFGTVYVAKKCRRYFDRVSARIIRTRASKKPKSRS